jgi:hypothetical protein
MSPELSAEEAEFDPQMIKCCKVCSHCLQGLFFDVCSMKEGLIVTDHIEDDCEHFRITWYQIEAALYFYSLDRFQGAEVRNIESSFELVPLIIKEGGSPL